MSDSKAPCACKHPGSEHAEIEGMARGHCKVPSCGCGAFDPGQAPAAPEAAEGGGVGAARHTYVARATDEAGEVGVEIRAVGSGSMSDQAMQHVATGRVDIATALCERAEDEFRKMTNGEEPAHSGVSLLPYFEGEDSDDD